MNQIKRLQDAIRSFNMSRDWCQYHTPAQLAMAIAVESAELMQCFQWLRDSDSYQKAITIQVEEEIADIAIYLLTFCDQSGFDLEAAIKRKLSINATRFPPKALPPKETE